MAMEATNETIWDWNIETDEITFSKSYEEIYGYTRGKTRPSKDFWFSLIHPDDQDKIRNSLSRAIEDPHLNKWREEYCIFKSNGDIAHIIDRAYIIRDTKGEAIRLVGAVLDVSESRRLLEEVQRQNKVLKEIAWEQSHIVRAPLARLKGLLYLLEIQAFEEIDRKEIIDLLNTSANELDAIVKGIVAKTEDLDSDYKENQD